MDKLQEGKKVFDAEIRALELTRDALGDTFIEILDLITSCSGKVIITGMGKPGHIARKISATFASLGTPSFYLHPAEAMHGDLGMVSDNDIVIAISYSGESDEIINILPNIKLIGAKLIGITGNINSTLAKSSDVVQVFPQFEEACHLGLAPTASTTAALCYGDALAVNASRIYGFTDEDFGRFHPAGSLGKKLLYHVSDVMIPAEDTTTFEEDIYLKEAIIVMAKKGLGIVTVLSCSKVIGVFTDGDLRRLLAKDADIYSIGLKEVMTTNPVVVSKQTMAVDALKILKGKRISAMPVTDENSDYCGIVTIQSIFRAGIVL